MRFPLGLFAWFPPDADKQLQTRSREQLKTQGFGYSFGCTGVVLSLLYVSHQRSDSRSDHRISKRSVAILDILITLTVYKLASPLSGVEFCIRDRILFQPSRYMVSKNPLFGRTFRIGTENVSETQFQTPKLDHTNAPTVWWSCRVRYLFYRHLRPRKFASLLHLILRLAFILS